MNERKKQWKPKVHENRILISATGIRVCGEDEEKILSIDAKRKKVECNGGSSGTIHPRPTTETEKGVEHPDQA
jgi:hypothetical protein